MNADVNAHTSGGDEHLEDTVFDPLRQDKVMTADFVGRLKLAVDAAVTLFDAAGVRAAIG